MKPILTLAFILVLTFPMRAADAPADSTNSPPAQPGAATPDSGTTNQPPTVVTNETASVSTNEVAALEPGTNELRMNFRGAPLNLVLDYLSDAAGFIINKEADLRGTVDVWSKQPISKDEAVDLLNSVLRKNGYAVTRNNRILTIVSMDTAKTADLDIISGSDPNEVERSDEVVTQIIPVRHASASQLMNNLQVLLPTSATLSVNESANSLILVATKRDIRRMLKIVTALDTSIASVSSIQVFLLKYADAKQLATVVQQLFAPTTGGMGGNNARGQLFNMFRGGGGFPGGGPGGGGGPGQGGNAAGARVVAAADDYSNSLIVSASPDLMNTISNMVAQVDQPISDVTAVRVFHLINADPTELADQFTQLFPDDTRSGNNNTGGGQRFRFFGGGGGFGGRGGAGAGGSSDSDRMRKKTRVIAVPDQRTSSLIVTAAAEMMDQIEAMVQQLDSSSAKKERVAVFELQNADPQDVYQVLQDLFNRNNTMRNNNANTRGSMLGNNNPLTQRATQQQNNNSSRMGGRQSSGPGTSSLGF